VHTDIEGAGFIHVPDRDTSTATLTAGWRVILQAVADYYAAPMWSESRS